MVSDITLQQAQHNQAPYDTTALIEHKSGALLTTCLCWILTPANGSPLSLPVAATNHTRDITLSWRPGALFRSKGGLFPSVVDSEAGNDSAGLDVTAVFDDDLITEEAIANGDWHGAQLEIFELNYLAPKMGELGWFSGRLGTVKTLGRQFTAEARPLTAIGKTKLGRVVRARCDVREFGDARCRKDLTDLTHAGAVDTVDVDSPQDTFVVPEVPLLTYTDGRILWTSGANAGRVSHVKSYDSDTKEIVLHYALPREIQAGDSLTAIEGCNRTQAACIERENIVNYRGFPFVTNIEKLQQIIRANG